MSYSNSEDVKTYNKKYREENREKLNASERARYVQNREEELKRGKKYRDEHKIEILIRKNEWNEDIKNNGNQNADCSHWERGTNSNSFIFP